MTNKYVKNWGQFVNESESEDLINKILDIIHTQGITALNGAELKYLNKYSKGIIDEDLEKFLKVDTGYVFVSKNKKIPLLRFEYLEGEEYEDGIIHKGTVYFNDKQYDGDITCTEKGEFVSASFFIYQWDEEQKQSHQIEELYDYEEFYDDFDKFFKNEVCPYLTYSI